MMRAMITISKLNVDSMKEYSEGINADAFRDPSVFSPDLKTRN